MLRSDIFARPAPASLDNSDEAEWPDDALQAFCLRMASHGQPVSTLSMVANRSYALQQLAAAHALDDPGLRELALAMFRHFERQRSGLAWVH